MKTASASKKHDVHFALGIRFDVAVADAARLTTERALTCALVRVTSWNAHAEAGRTYVRGLAERDERPSAAELAELSRAVGATVTPRPFIALDIRPHLTATLDALERALAGPGAPAGVVDAVRYAGGIAIDVDPDRTSLALVLALIDAVAGRARTIDTLRPLEDDVLAGFASQRLAEPHLNAGRIVETFSEPLIASGGA